MPLPSTLPFNLPGPGGPPTGPPTGPSDLAGALVRARATTTELRRQRKALKQSRTTVYIYKNNFDQSAGLVFVGRLNIRECFDYKFGQKDNICAPGMFKIRAGHHLSKFIQTVPNDPEECKNIIIRVDKYGGQWRWSGLMQSWEIGNDDDGDYLVAKFNDDLQHLAFMLGPPNPALPIPLFQFPRDFYLYAPLRWGTATFIELQIWRLEQHPYTLPNDPFDFESYFDGPDRSKWQIHIKSPSFFEDTSLWGVVASRMNTVDSVIADGLEDAQLSIRYRRVFTGEGETVTGLLDNNIANGALVYEIVDGSGFGNGGSTFFDAGVIGGAARSAVQFVVGSIEDSLVTIDDNESLYPDEYWQSSQLASLAAAPAYRLSDSHLHDLESKVYHSPATAGGVIVGGENPTVDAIVQLLIQATGNLIGYFLLGGFDSLGDIVSDIVMPFLVGTILAWAETKNFTRIKKLGFVHLHEIYQSGAENNVWSLSADAAHRGGYKATDAETCHTCVVDNSSWFMFGAHASIGDRMMSTCRVHRASTGSTLLFVNQIKEANLEGKAGGAEQFTMHLGQTKVALSSGERYARMMKMSMDRIHDIGVRLVSA